MNRTTGHTLRKNRGRASLACIAVMEDRVLSAISKTQRNRKEWLRKTFGGRTDGYYDDIYVTTRKR